VSELTEQEDKFLKLLARGMRSSEASKLLGVSRQRGQQLWKSLLDKGAINVLMADE
jgi:helix-turn-helix protein